MKLYVIFAQRQCRYSGEYAPEALAVADENTMDDNPEYLYGKLEEAKASTAFAAAEIFEILLSDLASQRIDARLNPMEVLDGDGGTVFGPA